MSDQKYAIIGNIGSDKVATYMFPFGNGPDGKPLNIRAVLGDNGEPLIVGKDVCKALGYANETDAMNDHCKGVAKRYPLQTAGGIQNLRVLDEGDVYRLITGSTLPGAQAFESLVYDEILPTIRKTGSYTSPQRREQLSANVQVDVLIRMKDELLKVKGVTESVAATCLLDAVERATGVPATMMRAALPAVQPEDVASLTATAIGKAVGLSGQKVNVALAELGLHAKDVAKNWMLTDKGARLGETKPFTRNGHSGYETRWKASVVEMVRNAQKGGAK